MATTHLKYQLEFSMGSAGWSEVYYRAGSVPRDAKAAADALVTERKKMLCSVATIHHVRISPAEPGAISYYYAVNNGAGALALLRDVGNVTVTLGAFGETGTFRKMKWHGCPDSKNAYNANGTFQAGMWSVAEAFMQYLKANAYLIRKTILKANADGLKVVTAIALAANQFTFSVDATGYAPGQKVRISGAEGYKVSELNGTWTIASMLPDAADGFKATTNRVIDSSFYYKPSSAKMRSGQVDAWTFDPIATWDDVHQSGTRKIGRPSDSPRGRR